MAAISNKASRNNVENHSELIQNVLAGNNHSASTLYYLLLPFVSSVIRERVFEINQEELQIMAHDIATIIFEKLPRYDCTRNTFLPWAGRITKNKLIDLHRRKRPSISLDKLIDETGDFLETELNPEQLFISNENETLLNRLLMEFSEEKRRLLFDYSEGKSMAELSGLFGKSVSAITSELFRTKKKLRFEYLKVDKG